jgi:hypothetical protein
MTKTTTSYPRSKRDRMLKPVFGAAAVFAAMATLSVAVIGPASVSSPAPTAAVDVVAYRTDNRPTEVAISPASIHVIATKRTKVARAANPYLPASYNPR